MDVCPKDTFLYVDFQKRKEFVPNIRASVCRKANGKSQIISLVKLHKRMPDVSSSHKRRHISAVWSEFLFLAHRFCKPLGCTLTDQVDHVLCLVGVAQGNLSFIRIRVDVSF